jgi:hypothetical protein
MLDGVMPYPVLLALLLVPTPPTAPLLSGPSVTAAAPKPTLVERGLDGRLTRLDDEPETAATLLLDLSAVQRKSIDALISLRVSALDKLITTHYAMIVEVSSKLQKLPSAGAEERAEILKRYAALLDAMKPWHARGTLLDEAAAVLTPEQSAAAHTLADEYKDAIRKDTAKDAGPTASALQVQIRANLEEFGRLVKQSIQRRADFAQAQLKDLVQQLDLNPEQTEQVRQLFMEYAVGVIQGTRDKVLTPAERRTIAKGLAAILTPEQRRKFGELMVGGASKEPASDAPMAE